MADIVTILQDDLDGCPYLEGATFGQKEGLILNDDLNPLLGASLDLDLGSSLFRAWCHGRPEQRHDTDSRAEEGEMDSHGAPRSYEIVQNHFFLDCFKDRPICIRNRPVLLGILGGDFDTGEAGVFGGDRFERFSGRKTVV